MPRIMIYLNLLTDCGEDRRGVVEGARELPRLPGFVGLEEQHHLLEKWKVTLEKIPLNIEVSQNCKSLDISFEEVSESDFF